MPVSGKWTRALGGHLKVQDASFFKDFIRMCNDGWLQGWHESNGGNLTYRLKSSEAKDIKECLDPKKWHDLNLSVPSIAGELFCVTASGSHFRSISEHPTECVGIIEVSKNGKSYRRVWGFKGGAAPTSELAAHLLVHARNAISMQGRMRVLYHAHPASTIALSAIYGTDSLGFTRALWGLLSECALFVPEGIMLLSWMMPGSFMLAEETAQAMDDFSIVVWQNHGILVSGDSFDEAFGIAHTVEKAAEIAIKVKSMHSQPKGKIPDSGIEEMRMVGFSWKAS